MRADNAAAQIKLEFKSSSRGPFRRKFNAIERRARRTLNDTNAIAMEVLAGRENSKKRNKTAPKWRRAQSRMWDDAGPSREPRTKRPSAISAALRQLAGTLD